jgi:23S rRNA pseudouridine1911/1915/1917 synthase
MTHITLNAQVPNDCANQRLDRVAAQLFPDYSRARLQTWIKDGVLTVNSAPARPRDVVFEGDNLHVDVVLQAEREWEAQPMELDIVFEDESLLVLNKATDVVVHPAAGHRDGTLLNGLLAYCPALQEVPRAGIVHRLDKDTTGLMMVAKTLDAHAALVEQLRLREVKREYEAVAQGVLTGGGTVDAPLGRHPVNRKRRAVVEDGQEAVTHYRVIKRYRSHTHIHVQLETGRTHQIRAHLSHVNIPLVGDPLYAGRLQLPAACSPELAQSLKNFKRQALHARRLSLQHPVSGEAMCWEAPLPADFDALLAVLARDVKGEDRVV